MMFLSGKEAYALFLESKFWQDLSYECRKLAGFRCGRCGKEDHCQAHHLRYPEHWFDTTLRQARSRQQISRAEFKRLKPLLLKLQPPKRKRRKPRGYRNNASMFKAWEAYKKRTGSRSWSAYRDSRGWSF